MPDIKTRDIAKGTIKTIDKSAVAAERMKSAFIQTKEKAEHSVDVPESSAEEYASNRLESGIDRVSHEAVHQFDKQGRKGVQATKQNIVKAKDGIQKFKEKRAAQSLQKQAQAAAPRKSGQGFSKSSSGGTGGGSCRRCYGESNRKSDSACGQGDYRRNKSVDRRNRRRRLDSGFGHYRDLPDRYDYRLRVRYLFLRRRFWDWNEYADRCAGDQYRIRYQIAGRKNLGIL